MKILSFDPETSREMLEHGRASQLEDKARRDADKNQYDPPSPDKNLTYWEQCQNSFEWITYNEIFRRRREKLEREPIQVSTDPRVDKIIETVISNNGKIVNEYKSGKEKALNSLVGMTIGIAKKEGITVDPAVILVTLKQQLQQEQ